jgi:predicted SnoaL-like aldol condensation-catalyzing enzyme
MEATLKKNAARLAVLSVGISILFIASLASPTHLDLANAQQNETLIQSNAIEEKNKALVLEGFDTLFNQRDYVAAERYWSPNYIQHSAHIEPGREGLFNLVKSAPPTLKYEPGTIVADGDFVIVHGKFSGRGQPVNWIAADILYIKDGVMVEHWDVIQDEASQEQSKSGLPMFGDKFPNNSSRTN